MIDVFKTLEKMNAVCPFGGIVTLRAGAVDSVILEWKFENDGKLCKTSFEVTKEVTEQAIADPIDYACCKAKQEMMSFIKKVV